MLAKQRFWLRASCELNLGEVVLAKQAARRSLHSRTPVVLIIINWVVQALNTDWLKAVIYEIFTVLITFVTSL